MRCLEFYSGIGGFAVAARQIGWEVCLAIDIDQLAAQVYRHNFDHVHEIRTIDSVSADKLASANADLWWMSPPCQPFTRRGNELDLGDSRTESFLTLLNHLGELQPNMLALENVPEFRSSLAAKKLRRALLKLGYRWHEIEICPTELGLPNRRRRFYLVASRLAEPNFIEAVQTGFTLRSALDVQTPGDLLLTDTVATDYHTALHWVRGDDPKAITSCFTSAYGKSPIRSGSYVLTDNGLRHFAPQEILRLLGFPRWFELPSDISRKAAWKLVGNSLSIPVVVHVLQSLGRNDRVSAAYDEKPI